MFRIITTYMYLNQSLYEICLKLLIAVPFFFITKNERLWVIPSGHSEEMSDRERIAQVAHQIWANERIAHFFEQSTHLLTFWQKTINLLRKQMSKFPALQNADFKAIKESVRDKTFYKKKQVNQRVLKNTV